MERLTMKRTRELYEHLKEIAGDTWKEPTFVHDTHVGDNQGMFFFPDDTPERSMEFHHILGEDYEKGLDIFIDHKEDEGGNIIEQDRVGYLRIWGSKPNSTRDREKYPELKTHMVLDDEEEKSLGEVWEWFMDREGY